MTKQDLHLTYRQDTGKDACGNLSFDFTDIDNNDIPDIQKYIDWLEKKVLDSINLK